MSQDPWKKAYRQSRAARSLSGAPQGRPPRRDRESAAPLVIVLIVLLPLLVVGGMFWYAWQKRGTLLPEYADQLPAEVVNRIDIPARRVSVDMLDEGLGIGLAIFGSQGGVVRRTSEWGHEWKLTTLGQGHLRLETSGLRLSAAGDVIETYEIDLQAVFADPHWKPWLDELRRANLEPQLNLREVQGDAELIPGRTILELASPKSQQYSGNWRHPAYELEFQDGWLRSIRGGMAIGPAAPDESATAPPG
jgi:hypothetical protein